MSRPFMVVGFVFLFSLIIFNSVFSIANWWILISLIILSAISLIFIRKKKGLLAVAVCFTVTAAYILFYIFTVADYLPSVKYEGVGKTIVAQLKEYPEENDYMTTCEMEILEISGQEVSVKTVGSFSCPLNAEAYDIISFKGDLKAIETDGMSGNYYKSTGIYLRTFVGKDEYVKTVSKPESIGRFFAEQRKRLCDKLESIFPNDVSGFTKAIFLGVTSSFNEETSENFRKAGCSHILAVSGLHMSVWVMSLFLLLRRFAVNDKFAAIISIIWFIVLFLLIGFRYSTARAGIMLVILLGSHIFEREADSLNSLGLAIVIICLINPFTAINSGFLLSVFATLGIITLHPHLYGFLYKPFKNTNKIVKRIIRFIFASLSVTVSATIFLIPIYVYSFETFSLVAPITNLLIITVSSVIMVLSAIVSVLFNIPYFSDFIILITEKLTGFVLWVVEKLASFSFAEINISQSYLKYWLVGCFIFCAVTLILTDNKRKRLIINTFVCSLMFIISLGAYTVVESAVSKIEVLDRKDGFIVSICRRDICVVINCEEKKDTAKTIENYLEMKNIDNIDLLFCHSQSDYIELQDKTGEVLYLDATMISNLSLNDEIAVNYFSKYDDTFYIEMGNMTALVCTKSSTDYESLPEKMKSADVLICNNSIPKSFDTNEYGEIIVAQRTYKLSEQGAYSTATSGTIAYRYTDDGKYEIRRAD